MAREMTPKERAEQVAHTYYSLGPTNLIDLIAASLQETRRAALLEAAVVMRDGCEEPNCPQCTRIADELTRLAQEG